MYHFLGLETFVLIHKRHFLLIKLETDSQSMLVFIRKMLITFIRTQLTQSQGKFMMIKLFTICAFFTRKVKFLKKVSSD